MTIFNLRLNILESKTGEIRVVSNIPFENWREEIYKVCYAIYAKNLDKLNYLEKIEATSMFYGGIGTYTIMSGAVIPIILDYIDKKNFYFYLAPSNVEKSIEENNLENWVILHFALREGLQFLLNRVCRDYPQRGNCIIKTNRGTLLISSEAQLNPGYIRLIPDNNPLRHVIVVDNY